MARDWPKVALAVLAAAALVSVCALSPPSEAQQARPQAKAGKAPQKSEPPAEDGEDGDGDNKAAAKKKRQDPAEAQRSIEAAHKALQAGKADQAAQTLASVLAGGNLPPATMARALYLRGVAYRQQSKPAQAISDLTAALWLKGGLTAEDRQEALKQRSGAYADAGLSEKGEVAAGPAPAGSEAKAPAKSWGVVTTPSEAPAANTTTAESGNNWFKSWFNNSVAPAQANPAPPATASIDKTDAPPRVPQAPAAARVSSAWSSNTEVKTAAAAPAETRSQKSRPAAETQAPVAEGKYRIQLATVRTQQEAVAMAAKAKQALAGSATREPEIDQTVLGNMGAFYRVRVGPFATVQETQAICAKVKGTGLDCLTVTQ